MMRKSDEMDLGRKMRLDFHGRMVQGLEMQMIVDLLALKSLC
jgi:uncharacterized membrane protein